MSAGDELPRWSSDGVKFYTLALHDPDGRRGLWVAVNVAPKPEDEERDDDFPSPVEVCSVDLLAGREGEVIVHLYVGQTITEQTLRDLMDVLGHARAAYRRGVAKSLLPSSSSEFQRGVKYGVETYGHRTPAWLVEAEKARALKPLAMIDDRTDEQKKLDGDE